MPKLSGDYSSIWDAVAVLANEDHSDASGLSPWWVLKDALVDRFVFSIPQGRDTRKFDLLREQRLVYRLALGQPNQEDLVEVLAKSGPQLREILRPLALNLSAFYRRHDPVSKSLDDAASS